MPIYRALLHTAAAATCTDDVFRERMSTSDDLHSIIEDNDGFSSFLVLMIHRSEVVLHEIYRTESSSALSILESSLKQN